MFFDGLCALVIVAGARGPTLVPPYITLHKYLRGVQARLVSLLTRIAAGEIPQPPRPRAPRAATTPRALRLSARKACLIRLIPYKAAVFSIQLYDLLSVPEVAAFMAANPRFGRILRPLCSMLGTDPTPRVRPNLTILVVPEPPAAPPLEPRSPMIPHWWLTPANATDPPKNQ